MSVNPRALDDLPPAPARPTPGLAERVARYVPRVLQHRLADHSMTPWWTADGTAVLVDIIGFTAMCEALARKGREGAEQVTEIVGNSFESIMHVAYRHGASLLKFGGDAMLLWFEGPEHAAHGCRAAWLMREALARLGTIAVGDTAVSLEMSQGLHSGAFHFFALDTAHLELLPVGPAWSEMTTMQKNAGASGIRVSAATAALLPPGCVGALENGGALLERSPDGVEEIPFGSPPDVTIETLAHCLSPPIRAHVLAGGKGSDHRPVTIAFLRVEGTDAYITAHGPDRAADALLRLMTTVTTAATEQKITFLASDVDHDGVKLILTSGAPTVIGDDEERMLLALQKMVASDPALPLRIGVHRGAVFAGDVGPLYRRTYTVMGDAVNLTARLMAKAEPGKIFATAAVLDRCDTVFESTAQQPFEVKGKSEPLHAWSVGRVQVATRRAAAMQKLPLTGRNAELGVIRKAYTSARAGTGRMIEVVGDAGLGKTRLLEALRDAAAGFGKQHAACEAYTASTPYAFWRELLRELMGFGRDDDDADVLARVRDDVVRVAPDLVPWLPLIATAMGIDAEPTPEVEMLAANNRRARLNEVVARYLSATVTAPVLIEIENAHHMDEASAGLLTHVVDSLPTHPWLFAVARRRTTGGFIAPDAATVVRIDLGPLAEPDALRLAQLATKDTPLPAHVLDLVAKRSGGNPQFLRDLLRTAVETGGTADLPDSAEGAAMAQIDALAPDDRALVRRAAVFGISFHPRMLEWFADDGDITPPDEGVWDRLGELFNMEPDGYLQFRGSLLRDAAYEGLPFKLRRKLHGLVAEHIEQELDDPDEVAGSLSLHYFEAAQFDPAWRYSILAAKRAEAAYADIEATRMYGRALEAGRQLEQVPKLELAAVHEAIGDALVRAGELGKALAAYTAAQPLVADVPLLEGRVLLKLAQAEGRLGKYAEALRWCEQARARLTGLAENEAARLIARASGRQATILQVQGKTPEALQWGERAVAEAERADDPEALGDACVVIGWAYGELGRDGAQAMMKRSLDAYERAGNRVRHATLLSDLGVICQWEGHWDEALSYYQRGREASLKIGNTTSAALARVNMADILIDRGEWAEAESALLETLPFWRVSQFRFLLAACLSLLGRVSLRQGRIPEARTRLDEARAIFMDVGAENEVPPVDARLAECHLQSGDADRALEIVNELIGHSTESNGIARILPLLERIQGHALMRQNDLWGARDALDASLAAAREQRNLFEAALTMTSLMELDRLEGIEPPVEMATEARELLAQLKVRALPPVPVPDA
jgi:class 3 adenylate cyclase/tetratricopeptide (TPR) repeat protein